MGVATSFDRLEIPLAKGKALLRGVGVLIFAALGLTLLRSGAHPVLGATVLLFCGFMFYFAANLLTDHAPGLVLSQSGLVINRNVGSGGTVPWKQVSALSLVRFGRAYQLVVEVRDPERFLARGNALYRALNAVGTRLFGSPVRINTVLLQCEPASLLREATDFRNRYGEAWRVRGG